MPRDSEQLFADLVKKGDSIMNCIDMMEIPELRETLNLRAGEEGLMHPIRWIYFADCLQCVKSEYRMESYIHGSEFVVLTNRDLTDDSLKLKELIAKMQEYDIAAVGSNLDGMDALLSIVQMPSGIPVATVAINGSKNAAYLALQIMAIKHSEIKEGLLKERKQMEADAMKANDEVIEKYK